MTPFLGYPDHHDRPDRLRADAAARRLAGQARVRAPRRSARIRTVAPGNDAA